MPKQRQEYGTFFLIKAWKQYSYRTGDSVQQVFRNHIWQHLVTGTWNLQSTSHQGAGLCSQSHWQNTNIEQKWLFSSKIPSTVCGVGGVGRFAGVVEATDEVGCQARRDAFTWVFASVFLPLFLRKLLIPHLLHPAQDSVISPFPLLR